MADTKISALTAATAAAAANELAINEAGTSKKISITQLVTLLQTLGMPIVTQLAIRYTNATTTGTEVTELSFNSLAVGTYVCRWYLLYRAAATTSSIKFGVNVTGTVDQFVANVYFPSAGVNAATGTMHNANNATTGQVWAYANTITESTTAPNLGPWVAVTNAAATHLLIVEAVVDLTGTGDIELWCASEVAFEISLEVGSSVICTRTN